MTRLENSMSSTDWDEQMNYLEWLYLNRSKESK